jgi:single-strand DNA-binding protein
MANFNKVILAGNLTRDPELHFTPKGTAIANLNLAINRRFGGEDGQTNEEVTFVEATAFGKTAELIAAHLKKGRPMLIEGRLNLNQWNDKATGAKRSKLSVVVETFQFMDSKQDNGNGPAPRPARKASQAPAAAEGEPPAEDDVPF